MDASSRARKLGPELVFFLKVFFILSFLVLALVDRNVKWFKKDQGRVAFWEAPLAGGFSALSFAALALWRQQDGFTNPELDVQMLFVASFVIFTLLQLFFELAGFNELSATSTTASKKFKKVQDSILSKKILYPFAFLTLFIIGCFAVCAKDSPPVSTLRFMAEGIIIGLGSAIPAYIVTRNRGGTTGEEITAFMSSMVLFGVLAHPFLQYSGMYREFKFMPSQGNG
jgi:hypothetical protein